MKALLEKLGIEDINPGGCNGPDAWIIDPKGMELVSYNPASGEPIARGCSGYSGYLRVGCIQSAGSLSVLAGRAGAQARPGSARLGRCSAGT